MKGAIVIFFVLASASLALADPTKDLFDALERSDLSGAKAQMKKHPNIKAKNENGETVLHVCARVGDARPMGFLVEAGARIDATNALGQTPLHIAAAYGHGQEVRALVKLGARIRVSDRQDMTPMDLAVQHHEEDTLEYLLEEAEREEVQIQIRQAAKGGGIFSAATVPAALAAGFFLTVMFSAKSGQ